MVSASGNNKNNRVSVKPITINNQVGATNNLAKYYSEISQDWAEGEGLIQNTDYSSKTYALQAKESATEAKASLDEAKGYTDNAVEQIQNVENLALSNISMLEQSASSTVEQGISNIEETVTEGLETINTSVTDGVNRLEDATETNITEINATAQPILSELATVEVVADNIDTVVEIGENIDNILNKTVSVGKVTTGEEGTNAEVVNSGTKYNPILDFTIPRGNTGRDGGVYTEYDEETETLSMISKTGTALFPEWGYVQGELDNQLDLKNALDAKQPVGDYVTKDEIPSFDGYVKNTDYAGQDKAGVIKASSGLGYYISVTGYLLGVIADLATYNSAQNSYMICKGTLGNILTQYSKTVLTTEADYNALETKDANTLYLIEE